MDNQSNSLNWFEIPVKDLNRAKEFYEIVFDIKMERKDMEEFEMAFFPFEPGSGKATGALIKSPMHIPSQEGSILYLNANPNLEIALAKVELAGGKILIPKTQITKEYGYMAFFNDTEGNKIAMHSQL
jgi:predicted enzyme related to lactoylglutathione lyase